MTYATRQDLESIATVDELAYRESVLPAGALVGALAAADAEINGYLVGRYVVPLTNPSQDIVAIAAVIARWKLFGDSATERARTDYQDALARLRDIQAGRFVIDSPLLVGSVSQENVPVFISVTPVFARYK